MRLVYCIRRDDGLSAWIIIIRVSCEEVLIFQEIMIATLSLYNNDDSNLMMRNLKIFYEALFDADCR